MLSFVTCKFRLKDVTRYSEDQIKNLKNLYVSYAELGRGLSINSFRKFMTAIFNIEGHPFSDDFFLFFDSNRDGLVDFYEMVIGMNTIEKGSFEEKCQFAFTMYDLSEADVLDTLSIREVLRRSYVTQIVQLD
jgi:Ca2+-binding EF-hand superfamily protein